MKRSAPKTTTKRHPVNSHGRAHEVKAQATDHAPARDNSDPIVQAQLELEQQRRGSR